MGEKTAVLYTHGSGVEIVEYAKQKLGLDLEVFTDKKNTPFQVRDFLDVGPIHGDERVHILDVIVKHKAEEGSSPLVSEWNAQQKVWTLLSKSGVQRAVVYSRPMAVKDGKNYNFDYKSFAENLSPYQEVGFSTRGVRHHNGEFIVFANRANIFSERPYGGPVEFFRLGSMQEREDMVSLVFNVVSSCIVTSNEARTFAIPCGRWAFAPPPLRLDVGGKESVIDMLAISKHYLAVRQSPQVRSTMSEVKTKSTAAGFGREQAQIQVKLPAALTQRLRGAPAVPATLPILKGPAAPSLEPP